MESKLQIILLVLIGLEALVNANNLKVGDVCQTRTGVYGICQLLRNCAAAKNDLNYRRILPTECGYAGSKQIVCCPNDVEPTISTQPGTSTSNQTTVEPNLPISVQKCREYSQYVYQNVTLFLADSSLTTTSDLCGHKNIPLIIGGSPASLGEFPHSVLLGYNKLNGKITWDCGGSLVSRRYVLTAAHCLKSSDDMAVSIVRLGELVLNDETNADNVIDIPVERRIKFPGYKTSKMYNDIALLKLAYKVELSPYIRPICLPTDDSNPAKSLATGWGKVGFEDAQSKALLKVVLQLYNNTECNNKYETYTQNRRLDRGIIETQICFGWKTEVRDTCQGDSGGPLQIFNSDVYCTYTQVGVTSTGVVCGSVDFPGLYTKVYNYLGWIEGIIWAAGEDD